MPGIVGITIKVIAVHGKLREMIQDVSGRRGMSQRVELMEYEKNWPSIFVNSGQQAD
jgi:hypothetical protein